MNRLKRIMLILLVVLLLPALFFSVYELSSLNDDEEMIRKIYDKQLDAILFSANQYADDILGSWLSDFQSGLSDKDTVNNELHKLFQFNAAIMYAFIADTLKPYTLKVVSPQGLPSGQRQYMESWLNAKDSLINQLIFFHRSGFQKIEAIPVDLDSTVDEVLFLFHKQQASNAFALGGLIIDTEIFIEEVLGPKLQKIAQEQFELIVLEKGTERALYSTTLNDSTTHGSYAYRKDLWLLPNNELAISTVGKELQTIINERTYTNLILIVVLDLFILLGIWLIFKNVKKEVQLAQSKSDFVSNVSHEIRTPLALISLFAETLTLGRVKDEEKKQEYYSVIHKEANRLVTIVNKILSFSQLDADKRSIEKQPISLNALVEDILNTYEFHLSSNGFEWEVDAPEQVMVLADKNALEEVFINLLDNAVKYSAEAKHITVTITKSQEQGIVSIKDCGVGISKADLPFIFDKFYRVHSGDLAKKKGTGLGLSLVKQIVEKLNGEVVVKSDLNKGTTFSVYLPLTKPETNG